MGKRRAKRVRWRYLRCPNCGKICMLPNVSHERPKGHIKTMVCFFCSEKVDMVELKEWGMYETI